MSIVLSTKNVAQVRSAVATYRETCDAIYAKLNSDIASLTTNGFMGSASLGFLTLFNHISPSLTTELTGTEHSITSMVEDILSAVERSFNDADVQLGESNITSAREGDNENG